MIIEALKTLRPGAQWNLNGDSVAGLQWLDQEQSRPSDTEIVAESERLRLPTIKKGLSQRLDDAAEAVRLRYITPGAGMAMTYNEKFAQAQGVNAIGKDTANAMSQQEREAQFPTLSASVGLEAATLWDCAQLVLQKYAQFAALSLFIERTRLSGKKAIAEAQSADAAKAAYEAIKWTP